MRVLVSTGLFYPAKLGGPANTLYWLSKALVTAGIDVSAIVTDHAIHSPEIPSNRWFSLDGIRVRYCSRKTPFGFRQLFSAVQEMKRCDVVILSSICYFPNALVYLFANLKGKKAIWSPRGELFESATHDNRLKKLYFRCLNRFISKKVIFHATSEQEKESILSFFPKTERVLIIPNYFELPQKEVRKVSDSPYFIYVGRINPIKALDNLLRGLAMSNQFRDSDYRFLFVGPDQNGYSDYLISLAKDLNIQSKISFCDGLYGKAKFEAYSNADFSFLISHSENFGNVVIESLSQGTPVVASKGTPWMQLNDEGAGYWIDNDPQSIANCIDDILSLPKEEYGLMRQSAEKLAHSFDVNTNIGTWIDVLESISH